MQKNYTEEAIEQQVPPESTVLDLVAAEVPVGEVAGEETQALIDKLFRVAYGRQGELFEHEFEGFPARVAQHEIDHLNGIRFPDRITDDKNLRWVEETEFGDYRKNWRNWSVNCPREKWESIKSGD